MRPVRPLRQPDNGPAHNHHPAGDPVRWRYYRGGYHQQGGPYGIIPILVVILIVVVILGLLGGRFGYYHVVF